MALLALRDDLQLSQHFLLSQEQRLKVADKINRLILTTQEKKAGTLMHLDMCKSHGEHCQRRQRCRHCSSNFNT